MRALVKWPFIAVTKNTFTPNDLKQYEIQRRLRERKDMTSNGVPPATSSLMGGNWGYIKFGTLQMTLEYTSVGSISIHLLPGHTSEKREILETTQHLISKELSK